MKKMMKLMVAIIVGVLMVACGDKKEEVKKIYVGTNAEFAPFEFLKEGKVVGFDIDLISEIAAATGLEVEIQDMAFDGLLPALQTKKVDMVIAGMTATEERKGSVNFTSSYYTANQVIIVKEDSDDISDFINLAGHSVGVVLGFTGDVVVSELEGVQSTKYNAAYAAIMDLTAGKVDAVVLDEEPAKNFVKNNEGLKIASAKGETEEYAMAVTKENEELLKTLEDGLKEIKKNGKYDELLKKWF